LDDVPGSSVPPPENTAARWFVAGLTILVVLGVWGAIMFRPKPAPSPIDVAGDPLLERGQELYQMRCLSCHGPTGKGDGPIAKSITNPPPGDLTDGKWKHGEQPEQVLRVIARGVPNTQMAGWSIAFDESDLRAVTAYVFHLAGREVPASLRGSEPATTPNDSKG
jgi:cytochrome c oxidase cbb3-type subunit 3